MLRCEGASDMEGKAALQLTPCIYLHGFFPRSLERGGREGGQEEEREGGGRREGGRKKETKIKTKKKRFIKNNLASFWDTGNF